MLHQIPFFWTPRKAAEALKLHQIKHLSYAAIARKIGAPTGTVVSKKLLELLDHVPTTPLPIERTLDTLILWVQRVVPVLTTSVGGVMVFTEELELPPVPVAPPAPLKPKSKLDSSKEGRMPGRKSIKQTKSAAAAFAVPQPLGPTASEEHNDDGPPVHIDPAETNVFSRAIQPHPLTATSVDFKKAGFNKCKFPLWGVEQKTGFVCGAIVDFGKSYCRCHRQLTVRASINAERLYKPAGRRGRVASLVH